MTLFILILAAIILAVSVLRFISRLRHDAREPPLVSAAIPVIGHLINIVRHGTDYYSILAYVGIPDMLLHDVYLADSSCMHAIALTCESRQRYNLPIYTIRLPGAKFYIASDPDLLGIIDRKAKAISFAPFIVHFAERLLDPTRHAVEALAENIGQKGTVGLRPETVRSMHTTLAGATGLQGLSEVAIGSVSSTLRNMDHGQVAHVDDDGNTMALFAWARQVATTAVSDAVYGPLNPLRDPKVFDSFWYIQDHVAGLGINILPQWTARKAYKARQTFFDGMHKYYQAGGLETASDLVKDRYRVNTKYGVSQTDIEHFELSVCVAMLINTTGTSGWMIAEACSRPDLVAVIHAEIDKAVTRDPNSGVCHLNTAKVVRGCPLLLPFFHEVVRVRSASAQGRVVLQDTWINDNILLKKGASLFIPSAVVHSNEVAWGPDATCLRPDRLCKSKTIIPSTVQEKKSTVDDFIPSRPPVGLRSFGRGAVRCPGQYFTENMVLSIVVMVLAKYRLQPCSPKGWQFPTLKPHLLASVLPPCGDIDLQLHPRAGYQGAIWNFTWDQNDSS